MLLRIAGHPRVFRYLRGWDESHRAI